MLKSVKICCLTGVFQDSGICKVINIIWVVLLNIERDIWGGKKGKRRNEIEEEQNPVLKTVVQKDELRDKDVTWRIHKKVVLYYQCWFDIESAMISWEWCF